jgi:nicotinate-nucleotide pyrophosphorylase (carboxylating)
MSLWTHQAYAAGRGIQARLFRMKMIPEPVRRLPTDVLAAIQRALDEDVGSGDVTTNSIVPIHAVMSGQMLAKQSGIIAGLDVAQAVCLLLDEHVTFETYVEEGAAVQNRQVLATVKGPARALLTAERTALNFLGRMSGIATLTRQFVDAIAGTQAVILDTRKTAPGLRALDKLAVRRGGGRNHRVGLHDMILIKDNHLDYAGSMEKAVQAARNAHPGMDLEVETRTLAEVEEALRLKVERILLDNMTLEVMRQAVALNAGCAQLEASGNVALDTVRAIAETGVDLISIGALTHSAKVFDVSFLWVES